MSRVLQAGASGATTLQEREEGDETASALEKDWQEGRKICQLWCWKGKATHIVEEGSLVNYENCC